MRPTPSSKAASNRMRANRPRDTGPELAVRRELHGRGMRYRVDHAPVPGVRRRADVVFPHLRIAVFIDGCFWHGCAQHGTGHRAKANASFWRDKIAANQKRDLDTDRRLREAGWMVIRVWEHEPPGDAADRVIEAVVRRRTQGS
ncbi:MAG TPA: very short patch repair endonuclease [Mycobacteriales bacterium]|nr:very short patch repair endonuclease [Mycobacteriales bacterium]